ncbi:hypothetical protein ABPG75_006570 [Micractinium tetrahymenae]
MVIYGRARIKGHSSVPPFPDPLCIPTASFQSTVCWSRSIPSRFPGRRSQYAGRACAATAPSLHSSVTTTALADTPGGGVGRWAANRTVAAAVANARKFQHGLASEQQQLDTAPCVRSEPAAAAAPPCSLQRNSSLSRSTDGVLLSPFCSDAGLPAFASISSPPSTGCGTAPPAGRKSTSGRPPRPSRDSLRSPSTADCWSPPDTPDRGSLEDGGVSAGRFASSYRPPLVPGSAAGRASAAARLGPSQLPELTSAFAAAALSRASSLGASGDLSTPAMAALSELLQLVRQQDAAEAAAGGRPGNSDGSAHTLLRCGSSVPAHLCKWLVDPSEVEYLHHPGTNRLVELGTGASCRVYKALLHGDLCAAKEVDIGRSASMRQLFLAEASKLAQLRHPHIVTLFGLALTPTKGVVLMELCEGHDLYRALQLRSKTTGARLFGWRQQGKRVALQVAQALAYLHRRGIMHCDIKSANVLLTECGTAKLTDLDLARCCAAAAAAAEAGNDSSSLVGTFAWMAPELLLGCAPSPAADVYSFGVLLHEIITGERPKRGNLRLPTDEECPQEVRELMLRCLSVEPPERPTSGELVTQLRLLKQGAGQLAEVTSAFAAAATLSPPSSTTTGGDHFPPATAALSELLQLARQQDAEEAAAGGQSCNSDGSAHTLLRCGSSVPTRLCEWLIEPEEVEYLHHPGTNRLVELGSGASCRVYKATLHGDLCAAKEVDIGHSPAMRQLFLLEASKLAQLRHPHIVTLFGLSLTPEKGVVLMELCEGHDLFRALQLRSASTGSRLFGWRQHGKRVALQVAQALAYLHRKNVMHCDIKSANVLLTECGTAKLTDLDLARCCAAAAAAAEAGNDSTSLVGTFACFGVLLHEIITGERPKRGSLRLPTDEECPQEVRELMLRCLSLEPSDRPTAADLVLQLRALKQASKQAPAAASK